MKFHISPWFSLKAYLTLLKETTQNVFRKSVLASVYEDLSTTLFEFVSVLIQVIILVCVVLSLPILFILTPIMFIVLWIYMHRYITRNLATIDKLIDPETWHERGFELDTFEDWETHYRKVKHRIKTYQSSNRVILYGMVDLINTKLVQLDVNWENKKLQLEIDCTTK